MQNSTPPSLTVASALFLVVGAVACGSSSSESATPDGSVPGFGNDGGAGADALPPLLTGDGSAAPTVDGGGCLRLECQQQACAGGSTTTISGTVYDPAGNNPLYDVVVYVPNDTTAPITPGVDSSSCSCDSLYSGAPIASALTDANGHFTLQNAPAGASIPLVIQIGKWRKQIVLPTVTACQDNPQPDKSLKLPKNQSEGDIPNIAVSTGNADTLECLLRRIGVDASEYTGGPSGAGRIHIFVGGDPSDSPAPPTMPNAPASSASLWDSTADLMKYDIVVLSCEGHETTTPNPKNLSDYVNAGGRAFAEHYHYAWFTTDPQGNSPYVNANLATWSPTGNGGGGGGYDNPITATIDTTLGDGGAFPKGKALDAWLGKVGALDANGQLPIPIGKYNASVGPTNVATAWADTAPGVTPASTQYLSFDTPLDAPLNDAGVPASCGRVVFSDLHVSGGGATNPDPGENTLPVPTGCANQALSADEDALEFMLFDLSSCVTPVSATPQPPAPVPQ